MILGYHTAGLLLHDEATAICELAAIGYRCVVIRPRRGSFNPLDPDFSAQFQRVADAVTQSGVDVIIDASSRFIHNPWTHDEPSLVSSDSNQRDLAVSWIERLVDVTADLHGSTVVIASGAVEEGFAGGDALALDRLAEPLNRVLAYAAKHEVKLALCPSSKTFVPNIAGYERLLQWLSSSSKLGLAADVGEMLASGELPVSERLARNADTLGCVLLCDAITGSVGDRRIGYGEVNLRRIVDALSNQGFLGAAIVRVEGHEHVGLQVAKEAFSLLS